MNKKNYLKSEAIALRRQGWSYTMITEKLGVPKGTLNGWFSGVILSKKAQTIIIERKQKSLIELRERGHSALKKIKEKKRAELVIEIERNLICHTYSIHEYEMLFLGLWLGEGFKLTDSVGFGNSNGQILKMFVFLVRKLYSIDENKFRCFLHLRMDQNNILEQSYWSEILGIPLSQFRKTNYDKRTLGKKTWIGYHGVCIVRYYDAEIGKRITASSEILLNHLIGKNKGAPMIRGG